MHGVPMQEMVTKIKVWSQTSSTWTPLGPNMFRLSTGVGMFIGALDCA